MAEIQEPTKHHDTISKPSNYSFILELGPASKLKYSLLALSDVEFNKTGTAMIQVESKDVVITVRDNEDNTFGYLELIAKGFIRFGFQKPLKRKMINLHKISGYLDKVYDKDVVTIWHIYLSNELSFRFGSKSVMNFGIDLLETDAKAEKFPQMTYAFVCPILTHDLRKFIKLQEANLQKLVPFLVTDSSVTFEVGDLLLHYKKNGAIKGIKPGQKYRSVFHWPYCESLKKASFLANGFLFYYHIAKLTHSITCSFKLQGLGGLLLIKEGSVLFRNTKQAASHEGKSGTGDNN